MNHASTPLPQQTHIIINDYWKENCICFFFFSLSFSRLIYKNFRETGVLVGCRRREHNNFRKKKPFLVFSSIWGVSQKSVPKIGGLERREGKEAQTRIRSDKKRKKKEKVSPFSPRLSSFCFSSPSVFFPPSEMPTKNKRPSHPPFNHIEHTPTRQAPGPPKGFVKLK